MSVRLSVTVCHVRGFCPNEFIHIFKVFFSPSCSHTILVFFHSKLHDNIPTGTPLTGASNAGGIGNNRDSRQISGYRLMTAGRANNNCDRSPCSLPQRPPRISESLFITTSMDDQDEEKRTEHNLIVCSSKSEEEIINNRRLHSIYCTLLKLSTDRHAAPCGLSATAGLLENCRF